MQKVHAEYSMKYLKTEKNSSDLPSSFIVRNLAYEANSLFRDPASRQEIMNICNSVRCWIAAGYDKVPNNWLNFWSFLSHVNLSIRSGVAPDQFKIVRLIPIFKNDDKPIFSNHRPMSILPIFSKLFERVIYNRLLNFLNKLSILSKNQFGFR